MTLDRAFIAEPLRLVFAALLAGNLAAMITIAAKLHSCDCYGADVGVASRSSVVRMADDRMPAGELSSVRPGRQEFSARNAPRGSVSSQPLAVSGETGTAVFFSPGER